MPKLSLNNILFSIMNKSETRVCSHSHALDSLGVEVTVLKFLGQLHVRSHPLLFIRDASADELSKH